MPRNPSPNGLRAVAESAGVSIMTVSRVLRNSPKVSEKTKQLVFKTLKQIEYKPDAEVSRLMARVRTHHTQNRQSVIAIVRDDISGDALHDVAYRYVNHKDINFRASQHGYLTEEFLLGDRGITPKRLATILRSRGIEGLIVSPQSSKNVCASFDYSKFACATLGYGLKEPALHRASTNMTRGILDAIDILMTRNYRRIGLAVSQWNNDRADQTYAGALLIHQQHIPKNSHVPILLFPHNNISLDKTVFCKWVLKHKPDVIISFDEYVPDWLTHDLKLRIPEDIGLVVHDWREHTQDYSGIDHQRPHVASAAVDMVATQLMHNEFGIPDTAHQTLISPKWREGSSVRLD